MSDFCNPQRLQHARLPCPSPTPRTYSNSCPLHWWCHPTISSFVIPFSSRLQSRPASLGDGFTTESMAIRKWEQEISPTCWHLHPWAHWLALTCLYLCYMWKESSGPLPTFTCIHWSYQQWILWIKYRKLHVLIEYPTANWINYIYLLVWTELKKRQVT